MKNIRPSLIFQFFICFTLVPLFSSLSYAIDRYDVNVAKAGTGGGTVAASPEGDSCGTECWTYDDGTSITVTATADANSIFTGWTGCDSVNDKQCLVTMLSGKAISVTFSPISRQFSSAEYDPVNNRYLSVYVAGDANYVSSRELRGQFINYDGTKIGNEIIFALNSMMPSLAYDNVNHKFLLVAESGEHLYEGHIYGWLIGPDTGAAGSRFTISDATATRAFPFVHFNSTTQRYLVVFNDSKKSYGQFVNTDGSLYGTTSDTNFLIMDADVNIPASYSPTGHKYLVVAHQFGDGHGYGQLLNDDGTPSGGSFDITGHISGMIYPAYDSTNDRFFTSWCDFRNGDAGTMVDSLGRFIATDGTLLGDEVIISNKNYDQHTPVSVYDPVNHRYAVVWQDMSSEGYSQANIYGQFINEDGTHSGDEFIVNNSPGPQDFHGLAYNSTCSNFLAYLTDFGLPHGDIIYSILGTPCAVPTLHADSSSRDFGVVPIGGNGVYSFEISNTGMLPLVIGNISFSASTDFHFVVAGDDGCSGKTLNKD